MKPKTSGNIPDEASNAHTHVSRVAELYQEHSQQTDYYTSKNNSFLLFHD
jgi:hypothetical protein